MTITLKFPDTPAFREALGTLAVHCIEDNAESARGECAEDARTEEERAKWIAIGDAYEAIGETITEALHPEYRR
jgi:hypothetical protein